MENKTEQTNLFTRLIKGGHVPDILDCIANLSSDEVFTPPELVDKILDLLPDEVWRDSNLKWLDPACKTGIFLRQIAKRLMIGLREEFPDEEKRREHIFHNMLYGIALTDLTALMSRRSLYTSKNANGEKSIAKFDTLEGNISYDNRPHTYRNGTCIYCGNKQGSELDRDETRERHAYNFIHLTSEEVKNMKFDVIVGNPPYQLSTGGGIADNSAMPIYQYFVEQSLKLDPKYLAFIIPSRWFIGGRGLDSFRRMMLNDRHIKELVDYPDANDCFPGVDISGGVCYFVRCKDYIGDCNISTVVGDEITSSMVRPLNEYDVLVRFNQAISILKKVQAFNEETLEKSVSSVKPFGIASTFKDFDKAETGIVDQARIYIRNKEEKLINIKYITSNHKWIYKYKVLLPKAYGERGKYPYFITGKPFVGKPGYCCSETYLVINVYDDEAQAENLVKYMKTKFFRFLVSLRKQTQNMARDCFKFVPLLPMNQEWTDEKLYERYDINQSEREFINSMVKEM